MKQTGYDLIELCGCALHGTIPDQQRILAMNLEKVYEMAKFHSLTAMTASVLLKAGITIPAEWSEARWKSIRKIMLFDAERAQIEAFLEANGIRYAPLKGILLKELYPEAGMREMADNDILYDKCGQAKLAAFMEQRGYCSSCVSRGNHDIFTKPPVYHFEMHTALFGSHQNKAFSDYFRKMENRLLTPDGACRRLFSVEEHYIYLTAHAYRHHTESGTGLRTLTDLYLYLQAYGASMDWEYVHAELKNLTIADYEELSRSLAQQLFSENADRMLTQKQEEMLEFFLFSGTFGTTAHLVKKSGALPYLWRRLFPDMEFYREFYPFFYRHKLLLPIAWCIRLVRALCSRRRKLREELREILKASNNYD